jgi:sialidase-1
MDLALRAARRDQRRSDRLQDFCAAIRQNLNRIIPSSDQPRMNTNRHKSMRLGALAALLCFGATCFAAAPDRIKLTDEVREKCLTVLRDGLKSDEFWPSIHAAEGLTLGGRGAEVIAHLQPKLATEKDDQRRCGLARELVRAGQRQHARIMLNILAGEDSHGHVHAAESLYKVAEIGDGGALRKAFADTSNVPLQMMAAAALGRCGNPEAMAFLRKQLKIAEPDIARIAGWVLGRIGSPADIPDLTTRANSAEETIQRVFYHNSLAALGDKIGMLTLENHLKSFDPATRTYGATFAGDARATQSKKQLTRLLDDPYLDARLRAAQSLLVLASAPPPDRQADIAEIVYPATKSNPRYTEGSVVELNDGSLIFAVTEFFGNGSDFAKAHIVARQSSDGGRTWGDKRILQKNTGGLNVMSATLRRLPAKGAPDRIALFYLQKNSHSDLDLYARYSTDECQTFGERVLVTPNAGYHVVNNDRITRLSTGRLLAPTASTSDATKVNHFTCRCYISDDEGLTWRAGKAAVDLPKRGAMEPEVIELKDGRILMIMRNQLGTISKSYSRDGGDTWSPPGDLGVTAPEAPATLRRIPATGDLLLIWNNTYTAGAGHGGERTPLTAAISTDEGQTWKNVRNLETNPKLTYSYTSLTFAQERAVMTYWVGDRSKRQWAAKFRSLPVSWFYK